MAVTSRFPPVVVGVDGSDPATAAARVATAEARRRLLPVHLVRTLVEPLPGHPAPTGPPGREAARRAALDELRDLRASLLREYPGGQITTALDDGSPVEALLAEAASAAMVVLGAGSPAGVLGRARAELVRRAPCPVLCVAEAGTDDGRRPVLALVEGGDAAATRRVLSAALLEATTRGSDLVVVDLAPPDGSAPVGPAVASAIDRMRTSAPGVAIRCRAPERAAEPVGLDAQLLVVGRGDPARALRPVLRSVLGQASVPVLVVPSAARPASAPVLALTVPPTA